MNHAKVWEFENEQHMQMALAGSTPRDEYLRNRHQAAEWLVGLFGLDGTQRGFEIGAGEGIVASSLAPHCRSLDCTDISESFLAKARETCRRCTNVNFHRIETNYLDFLPAASYDFGYSINVFIHFNAYDVYHYLISARHILNPGGVFYFTAATIGESTRDLFQFFAHKYLENPDPAVCRSYMQWMDLPLLQAIIKETDLIFRNDRFSCTGGHLKVLVQKP